MDLQGNRTRESRSGCCSTGDNEPIRAWKKDRRERRWRLWSAHVSTDARPLWATGQVPSRRFSVVVMAGRISTSKGYDMQPRCSTILASTTGVTIGAQFVFFRSWHETPD